MITTDHTQVRFQQRGVTEQAFQTVMFASDRKIHLGSGCTALCLSRKRAQCLRDAGLPDSIISRAEKVTLIVNEAGVVVTVLKGSMAEGRQQGRQRPRRGGRRNWEWERGY